MIPSRLMREAVIDVEQRERRAEAAKRILELREEGPRISSAEIDEARRLARA